ncbi:MAG: hypothetical protein ACWGKN_10950 [Desulfoprunum sp.]
MSNLKEMEEFFNEFLRKYESGEIPKEEWETQPPAELHLFRRRRMVPVPPNLLQQFSESESSSSATTATSKTRILFAPPKG